MPIQLPNLDDRNHADLVNEAIVSIPVLHPQWTDHNPSDPGVALIELFAWFTDMLIYRTNLVPTKTHDVFLKLLRGPNWKRPEGQDVETAIRETVTMLRERYRAVSEDDYEHLTMHTWPETKAVGVEGVARVHCLAERIIDNGNMLVPAPGYLTLVVVPDSSSLVPSLALVNDLTTFFMDRKLVTTRLRVRGACSVNVKIGATLYLKDDARSTIGTDVTNALLRYFDPREGGRTAEGWPWGRAVYPSDVYAVLDEVPGIDYVENVSVVFNGSAAEQQARSLEQGGVKLFPHELVTLLSSDIDMTLMERRGDQWLLIG